MEEGFFVDDCVAFMSRMDEKSIDLTVTSPPYDNLRNYKGYSFDFENIAKHLYRVTKGWEASSSGSLRDKINGGRTLTSFRQGLFFQDMGFLMHDVMIYQKKNTPFMRSNAYTNCYEFMFVLSRGKPNTFNPLKVETVRHGMEMLTHNKGADGVNKKVLKELKKEKTRTNICLMRWVMAARQPTKLPLTIPRSFPKSWRRIISCLGQIPAISSSIPCAAVARRAKWP